MILRNRNFHWLFWLGSISHMFLYDISGIIISSPTHNDNMSHYELIFVKITENNNIIILHIHSFALRNRIEKYMLNHDAIAKYLYFHLADWIVGISIFDKLTAATVMPHIIMFVMVMIMVKTWTSVRSSASSSSRSPCNMSHVNNEKSK